ncbi:MAG TPA: metalloregulator ArsR/SmtB family transcription factor [Candidatus Portnoybacteria bacterium]|nr:metalloregulator ArsR/SmtB family transcription factor [Candidatus Portnoybacteria bacterium]
MKTKETVCHCSHLLNALSDANRLGIILFLGKGEKCVCDILGHLKLPQNLVSHHLKVLRQKQLIKSRREGRWIFYSLNCDCLKELRGFLDKIIKNNKLK